jgi:hypothetical protein
LLNERVGGAQIMVAPKEVVPEAPQTLVAPTPVTPEVTKAPVDEKEVASKAFGTSLGYYLTRKANNAPVDERESLLKQMKATYVPLGIDMSIVDRELSDLAAEKPASAKASAGEAVVTPSVAKPVEKPVVAPANTAAEKPVKKAVAPSVTTEKLSIPASTPDIERGWMFYKQAVGRGISDSERIELLQSIIDKFGSSSAEQVNKEISKIKKRMQ